MLLFHAGDYRGNIFQNILLTVDLVLRVLKVPKILVLEVGEVQSFKIFLIELCCIGSEKSGKAKSIWNDLEK